MATTTYEPIESYTLSADASSVTFGTGGTIPQTYTDLVLVIQASTTHTDQGARLYVQFNGSTSLYSDTWIEGNGSVANSSRDTSDTYLAFAVAGNSSTSFGTYILNIQNYANTSTYKTTLSRSSSATSNAVRSYVGLWRSTNAINTFTLRADGNYRAGSTFTLYGIANADIGAKATGGVITYDNTYYYHTFGASGTFTPKQSLTADILVVGGGGGGAPGEYANTPGGGGGAGGLLGFASQSLSATGYTVTVGSGGTGGASGVAATNGGDSQFGALTLVKGGGRGAGATGGGSWYAAGSQGSGGGGSGNGAIQGGGIAGPGGTATSGQGNNGGTSIYDYPSYSDYASAGGGGKGAAGSNPTSATTNGAGGIGTSVYSSWGLVTGTGENVSGTVYYAGGGGVAGTSTIARTNGGYGGGGRGALSTAGNVNPGGNGLANTGGGGGSGVNQGYGNGGKGGSGVVIVRYPK